MELERMIKKIEEENQEIGIVSTNIAQQIAEAMDKAGISHIVYGVDPSKRPKSLIYEKFSVAGTEKFFRELVFNHFNGNLLIPEIRKGEGFHPYGSPYAWSYYPDREEVFEFLENLPAILQELTRKVSLPEKIKKVVTAIKMSPATPGE